MLPFLSAIGAGSTMAAAIGPASAWSLSEYLTVAACVIASAALGVAWRARRSAGAAREEAGQARLRAQEGAGGVTQESLTAVERMWSTRFAALESQLQGGGSRQSRPLPAPLHPDLSGRVDELEKSVAGLVVMVRDLKRSPVTRDQAQEPAVEGRAWPAVLSDASAAMREVRQALAEAASNDAALLPELFERLRETEKWSAARPGVTDLVAVLLDISSRLLGTLRRDTSQSPLIAALFSDRVLAALRPAWKGGHPQIDCRTFLPGATFDPEWMEDCTSAGLRRPVISEALSWAVFEKLDRGRRVLARAKVTTD